MVKRQRLNRKRKDNDRQADEALGEWLGREL